MNDKIIDFIRKKLDKQNIENHRRFEKAWQDLICCQ